MSRLLCASGRHRAGSGTALLPIDSSMDILARRIHLPWIQIMAGRTYPTGVLKDQVRIHTASVFVRQFARKAYGCIKYRGMLI